MPLSVLKSAGPPAILALADGTIFHGVSIGAPGETSGEVVFNTSMTGYQEILSDPSYARQIVTLTYPHIGNTGTTPEDMEADHVYAAGLVIRDLPRLASNFRSTQSLQDFLKGQGTVAIAEIDTRRLTRLLRDGGAQNGAIVAGHDQVERALTLARGFPGLSGMDLAREVGVKAPYVWMEGKWALGRGYEPGPAPRFHVVAYDYGVKRNILRLLAARGCKVTVLPPMSSAEDALALSPDGIFLSNGPGDPEPCDYAIKACRALMDRLPVFGICLGHQIMGLAVGGRTHKMKFGHHGGNHPVQDLETG
jgi:carbamoyl-phosphate synthase small subunit